MPHWRNAHYLTVSLSAAALTATLLGACAGTDPGAAGEETGKAALPALSSTSSGPFTSCANDGICNLAYCSLNEDPDCVENNCDLDGNCNPTCASDPDCPVPEVCDRSIPWTISSDSSSCDAAFKVRRQASDVVVQARNFVEGKWPDFAAAQSLDYDEDNDGNNESGEDCWREGHAEANLEGFGVSLTRGGCDAVWNDVHGVEGDLHQPSLLFFEKIGSNKANWKVIGAGYHFDYDACDVPCFEHVPAGRFLIHEAGWHRVPGDGGFDCVQQQWIDNGTGIDVFDQCTNIEKEDFHRTGLTLGINKHERVWTLHMWFEPDGAGVSFAPTDPWCRWEDDGSETIVTVDCPQTDAFYEQTQDCGCE